MQGEEQQKLDILANQIFISYLRNSYTTCFIGMLLYFFYNFTSINFL